MDDALLAEVARGTRVSRSAVKAPQALPLIQVSAEALVAAER